MKSRCFINFSVVILFIFLIITGCQKNEKNGQNDEPIENLIQASPQNGEVIPGKYIVTLGDYVSQNPAYKNAPTSQDVLSMVRSEVATLAEENKIDRGKINFIYGMAAIGFAVELTEGELTILRADKRVKNIEPDRIVGLDIGSAGKPEGKGPKPKEEAPAQVVPPGISRVGYANYTGTKKAWIIDTGIDLDHPDLRVNTGMSRSFLTSGKNYESPDDDNGHGTHVAGTVGAIDNGIGVMGVAAGVELVSIRVLDHRGSGTLSGVIAGVDYVAMNATSGDVANMSLGGGAYQALDDAVINAAGNGILFSLAAGNESANANNSSPARANAPNIFTVSAMNAADNWASFSNYGNPPVDYCSPGVNINSCWKNGDYNTISGTSMAAPHVAGLLIWKNSLPLKTDGNVKNDPDGTPDPIAVK